MLNNKHYFTCFEKLTLRVGVEVSLIDLTEFDPNLKCLQNIDYSVLMSSVYISFPTD